jgi:uncharacterized membrane protein
MTPTGASHTDEIAMDEHQAATGGDGAAAMRRIGPPPRQVGRHPVVVRLDAERAANLQLRLADRITSFAGSMPFVYLHVLAFGSWMLFVERSPWPTLTLAVSLEAIFLSTFVMIGQNRQSAFQQEKADHDFREQEQELKTNTELTRAIHVLTRELHAHVMETRPPEAPTTDS